LTIGFANVIICHLQEQFGWSQSLKEEWVEGRTGRKKLEIGNRNTTSFKEISCKEKRILEIGARRESRLRKKHYLFFLGGRNYSMSACV
jgi:hypothetical protein